MKMLVLAGGFGSRLLGVVSDVPKALAPIGEVPFLRLQIEHWVGQGIRSFVFLLHYQADQIIAFLKSQQDSALSGCKTQWVVEPAPMDTGGAIAYAVELLQLSGDFLVTNADTWLGSGINDVWRANAPAMAVVELGDAGRYGRVQLDKRDHVTDFHEKNRKQGPGWVNAGLCHLDSGLFKDWNHSPFSLERITFPFLSSGGVLKAVPLRTDFIDIGVPEDYFRFCSWIAAGRKGEL